MKSPLSIGKLAETACVMEVLAPKPGNVYPGAEWNFRNTTVLDFLKSARAIAPVFDQAERLTVGELVLQGVQATRGQVSTNTNLGQLLLLAPLAVALARRGVISPDAVNDILNSLTVDDSIMVYQAIRLAQPGGMGQKNDHDIHDTPTRPLLQIMQMVQAEDAIAQAYATGFTRIFQTGLSALMQAIYAGHAWRDCIVSCHMELLALGDTLIRRKAGAEAETMVALRAREINEYKSDPVAYARQLAAFDTLLRSNGNRLNPGATADLVTATLFVALDDGQMQVPDELDAILTEYNLTKTKE